MYKTARKHGAVEFSFRPDHAVREVAIAGEFSDWRPLPMRRTSDGIYVRKVQDLPCRCEYKFFVDGVWRQDPDHDQVVRNSFGSLNSVAQVC